MVRDGVLNMVDRLRERGLDPRRIGGDAWEARCPAHRGAEHSLAICRNEFNHVVLTCQSVENCQHSRIIRALGWTNDHVYAETPDWLISRLRHVPIQPPSLSDLTPLPANVSESSADVPSESWPTDEMVLQARVGADDAMLTAGFDPGETDVAGASNADGASATSADSPTGESPPFEQMPGNSIEVVVSSISATMERGRTPERQSAIQVLARLASSARLFRSADGRLCAQVPVGDRLEIFGLKSAAFRDWLIDGFLIDQPEPPSSWAIRRVVGMLEARARFNTGIPEVFIRVGQDGDGGDSPYFLDLGDPSGRAVAISDQGWQVVDRPGVHFRRPDGLLPLPLPAHDGSIDLLRPYVNLTDADFRLMVTWLTAALRPVGPYPILVLNGEQAAGKSTLVKILRLLIDPQVCPVLALPSSTEDLMATAVNGWLLVYDNISAIAGALSDCICQLAFGGGFASRTLYTNDERSVIYAQRPVILVGIADFVLRGDLRDRSVFLHLSAIADTSRRAEGKFWQGFRADYPSDLRVKEAAAVRDKSKTSPLGPDWSLHPTRRSPPCAATFSDRPTAARAGRPRSRRARRPRSGDSPREIPAKTCPRLECSCLGSLRFPALVRNPRHDPSSRGQVLDGISRGLSPDLGRRARRDRGRPARAAVSRSQRVAADGRLCRVGRSNKPGHGMGGRDVSVDLQR